MSSDVKYSTKIQLSASSIRMLCECSWLYYARKVLRLPEEPHPKTKVGSIVHKVLEVLKNPRHKHHFSTILKNPKTINNDSSIVRLVNNLIKKYEISPDFYDEIDQMIVLGLETDFFHEDAIKVYPPEKKFVIETDKYEVVGYIDELAEYDDKFKIRDWKTQAKKFTKTELLENIQASIYQLGIFLETGKLSEVEFVMLRHPPTKRKPDNHIQKVESYSENELKGLQHYLDYIADYVSEFDENEAQSNFKADRPNERFFCEKVCQYRDEFSYYALLDDQDRVIRTAFKKDDLDNSLGNQIVKKRYDGCPRWQELKNS